MSKKKTDDSTCNHALSAEEYKKQCQEMHERVNDIFDGHHLEVCAAVSGAMYVSLLHMIFKGDCQKSKETICTMIDSAYKRIEESKQNDERSR